MWLPELILHGTIQRYHERALIGAYDLVEDRLATLPQNEWDEVIADLQRPFRHGLVLYIAERTGGRRDRAPASGHRALDR